MAAAMAEVTAATAELAAVTAELAEAMAALAEAMANEKKTAGFREIEADIKSGAADQAAPILLFGEEIFLTAHYEHLLVRLFSGADDGVPEAASELDTSVFRGGEDSDDDILSALDTFPMLSPHRVVVVKNHAGLSSEGKTSLPDALAAIPETSRLIFTAGNVNRTRALYKAIAKYGKVYEFTRLSEFDLKAFVQKRFRAMGVSVSPDLLADFCRATGYLEKDSDGDLFGVENEAKKLAAFALASGRTEITGADLAECLPDILRTDAFAMLDAISSGRKGKAIELLENSLASGESAFRLLSLIIGHFEIMLGYKELHTQGHGAADIVRILRERSDWRVKKLGGFAERFSEADLHHAMRRLYDAEKDIRSGDIPERLALTLIFAEI
ncbi:MAG: DNA polymerase III subunit delta [Clostridiales Family XIII bacterium]|jgi:DNA polymerase-3 subunit delta|nr:DNA polymerase III subunit delta [Clostridiales Family XIII bacterium]